MKKVKFPKSFEMASNNSLTIVAMNDDLVRDGRVLNVGIEAEFIAYIESQREVSRRLREMETKVATMHNDIKTLQKDKMTLETKLKHARKQIEVEINKKKRVEDERNTLEKQVMLVRELLQEKNSNTFTERDRERLAVIQHNSLPRQTSSQKTINSDYHDDNDDSNLTPSDVSYDKTEEDVFSIPPINPTTPIYPSLNTPKYPAPPTPNYPPPSPLFPPNTTPRPRKRPSAPPCDDDNDGGSGGFYGGLVKKNSSSSSSGGVVYTDENVNGTYDNNNINYNTPHKNNNNNNQWSQRKRETDKQAKKHRRSKSADLVNAENGSNVMIGDGGIGYDVRTPGSRNRRNSSPFASPFARHNSQDSMTPGWNGELVRFNSGNSLTRPHLFILTKHFKGEHCFVCSKKLKFGLSQQKCKDCKIWVHEGCRTQAPLPCMAIINTPKHSKHSPMVVGDYAPSEPPYVPAIVILCINEVESRGLGEQGLYRVPGNVKEVKELKERFQCKGKSIPNLNSISDIHVVCGFFKDFLRNLKESILTHKLWNEFHKAAQKDFEESEMMQVVSLLPLANRDTLAFIILHLQKVSEVKEVQMDVSNLSMVFAPTLIGSPHPSSPLASLSFETLLNHQRRIILSLMEISSDYWYSFIKVQDPSFQSSITPSNGSITPSGNTTMINQPSSNNNNNNMNNAFWSNKNVGWFNNVNPSTPLREIQTGGYVKKTSRFFAPPK